MAKLDWLLYRVEFQKVTRYVVVRDFAQLTKKLIELYGPKTKIDGMEILLVNRLHEEVLVLGR